LSPIARDEVGGLTAIDWRTGGTVKVALLLVTPFTLTTTGPVVAPDGTVAIILPATQLDAAATVPLNETVFEPWLAPKPDPAIVTDVPEAPELGVRVLITGVTVKVTLLLAVPPTFTTIGPVVAFVGTGATIIPVFQLVGVAVMPLKVIVLDP
jgi:hypothetical protein